MKTIITLVVLVALIFGSYFVFRYKIGESEPAVSQGEMLTPQEVTLKGTFVCLPHKDTSGPQTMECAQGLKAEDGNFYAVDMQAVSDTPAFSFPSDTSVTIEGQLVPVEALSTDMWNKYGIKGIMKVSKVTSE